MYISLNSITRADSGLHSIAVHLAIRGRSQLIGDLPSFFFSFQKPLSLHSVKCCLQVWVGLFPQDFPYCCPFPCLSRFGILWDPIHTEEHSAFHVFSKPFLAAVNFLLSSRLSSSTEVLRVEKALAQHCGKTVMTKMLRCAELTMCLEGSSCEL